MKRNLERTTVRIENERRKDKETPGRIRERMKILERIRYKRTKSSRTD